MKKAKKFLALASALTIFSSMSTAGMTAYAKTVTIEPIAASKEVKLPSWVPQNFASALRFYNQHGCTYIADNVICLVRCKDDVCEYGTVNNGSTYDCKKHTLLHENYTLKIPERPKFEDYDEEKAFYNAFDEYETELSALGLSPDEAENYGICINSDIAFEVTVYEAPKNGNIDISWTVKNSGEKVSEQAHLTFEVNDQGNVVETDYRGWLPDSTPEFNEFRKTHEGLSVMNGYIVFCGDVSVGTGYSYLANQNGDGKAEEIINYNMDNISLMPMVGGSSQRIVVYKPSEAGKIHIKCSEASPSFNSPTYVKDEKSFEIDKDMSVKEIFIKGDINGDFEVSLPDVVLMQKNLSDKNASYFYDVNGDGKINVFDLIILKRMVIEK